MKHKIFFAICMILAFISRASILTVTNTNNSGPGSLREAISNASEGDEVRFSPSLIAGGNSTVLLTSEIEVVTPITINGLYNTNDTLYISGGNTNRIFNVALGAYIIKKLVLDSLVLINGNGNITGDWGGAVVVTDTDSLIVSNSRLSNNVAVFGGAIGCGPTTSTSLVVVINNSELSHNSSSLAGGAIGAEKISGSPGDCFVFLSNSSFLYNYSYYGGAIKCSSGYGGGINTATVKIDSCNFINNTAEYAAGIQVETNSPESASSVIINNSTFNNNQCSSYGGAVNSWSVGHSSVSSINSTFTNNSALEGAAIYAYGASGTIDTVGSASVEVINSTFIANSAAQGAAICIRTEDSSSVEIYNSTIFDNTCSSSSDGSISVRGDEYVSIKTRSSIIALNSGGNFFTLPSVQITSLGYNIFSNAVVSGSVLSDQLGATAGQLQLGTLQLNGGTTATLQPASGSIAINNGDPADVSDAQNGVICGIRDVGAAENCGASVGLTDKVSGSKTLVVSPNPSFNEVAVRFDGDEANLIITDVMGKLIEEKIIHSGEKIDLRNYTNGIYFLIVEINKVRSISKVVKQ